MPQFNPGSIERETLERNRLNNYYQAFKDNEKIFNEQMLYDAVQLCQQRLAQGECREIEFLPILGHQHPISSYLPETLRDAVLYIGQETGFDDLTCTILCLAVISTALCGRFRVVLKPAWEEPVLFYTMLIAESGLQKDSLINLAKCPLTQKMAELQADYDNKAPQKKLELEVQTKAFKGQLNRDVKSIIKARANFSDGTGYAELMKDAKDLSEKAAAARRELDAKKVERRPELFFSDATEKGLPKAQSSQGGHLAAIEVEAGPIEKIVHLGARFNIDLFLKSHDQREHIYTNADNQASLLNPSLNLFYCVQPGLASKFLRKSAERKRGLAPRFMLIFPMCLSIPRVQWDYTHQFRFFSETLKSILGKNFTQDLRREIYSLKVTPDALTCLEDFQNENLSHIQNGHAYMASFLSKLHGKACRIAAVLHLWECYSTSGRVTDTINARSMESGIGIARALFPHAAHAFSPDGLIGLDPAQKIYTWLKESRQQFFSKRTLRQAIDSSVKNDLLECGLQRLVSCNFVGEIHDHEGKPIYVVNPKLCGWFISPIAILPPAQPVALPLPQPPVQLFDSRGLF